VVGKFWPPHRGHQLLLETAAAQVKELLVLVYANPDSPTHTAAVRAGWLRALYRGDEVADGPRIGSTPLRIFALTAEADGVPPDAADDTTHREFVRQWLTRQARLAGRRGFQQRSLWAGVCPIPGCAPCGRG
jgi:cytidyltransferase-like protein